MESGKYLREFLKYLQEDNVKLNVDCNCVLVSHNTEAVVQVLGSSVWGTDRGKANLIRRYEKRTTEMLPLQ